MFQPSSSSSSSRLFINLKVALLWSIKKEYVENALCMRNSLPTNQLLLLEKSINKNILDFVKQMHKNTIEWQRMNHNHWQRELEDMKSIINHKINLNLNFDGARMNHNLTQLWCELGKCILKCRLCGTLQLNH